MCESGRVLHHLKHAVDDPLNTIVIVTHDIHAAVGVSDTILLLGKCKIAKRFDQDISAVMAAFRFTLDQRRIAKLDAQAIRDLETAMLLTAAQLGVVIAKRRGGMNRGATVYQFPCHARLPAPG